MNKYISRIRKRENILALVLIIGAILGSLGIPQQTGFTSEQLILALLAVLGFDVIVERVGYLERIETNIANLENKIEPPQISADNLFLPREAMKPFLSWMGDCEEMWFAGKDLNELLSSFSV